MFIIKNSKIIFDNFFIIICLPFVISIPIYFIAIDWGRFLYINYNLTLILFYYALKKKLFLNSINNSFFEKYNIKIKILVIILFCFSWSPKILNTDDIGSFPVYRILYKFLKYLTI